MIVRVYRVWQVDSKRPGQASLQSRGALGVGRVCSSVPYAAIFLLCLRPALQLGRADVLLCSCMLVLGVLVWISRALGQCSNRADRLDH